MVMAFSARARRSFFALLLSSAFSLSAQADQIVKTDGTAIDGQITGVSDGQVGIRIGTGSSIVYLSDIKSVTMDTPAAMTGLKNPTPAQTIAALEPLVKQYAGLPADWVPDAMSQLADAYDAQGQGDKSSQIYAQMKPPYPALGQAKHALKEGHVDEALAAVKPIIDDANKNVAPSPSEGRLFAKAFLVYGQALEAQKQFPQALEAYLTVKTMFYQSPALVTQADQLAQALRAQNPGLAVD
jgi:tetratricopeptide (TPR) repeat protein